MTEQKTTVDFEALRRAAERNDAEMRIVKRETRPARRACCGEGGRSPSI
jgi:hypothetical protein